jgi:hypothetical protein
MDNQPIWNQASFNTVSAHKQFMHVTAAGVDFPTIEQAGEVWSKDPNTIFSVEYRVAATPEYFDAVLAQAGFGPDSVAAAHSNFITSANYLTSDAFNQERQAYADFVRNSVNTLQVQGGVTLPSLISNLSPAFRPSVEPKKKRVGAPPKAVSDAGWRDMVAIGDLLDVSKFNAEKGTGTLKVHKKPTSQSRKKLYEGPGQIPIISDNYDTFAAYISALNAYPNKVMDYSYILPLMHKIFYPTASPSVTSPATPQFAQAPPSVPPPAPGFTFVGKVQALPQSKSPKGAFMLPPQVGFTGVQAPNVNVAAPQMPVSAPRVTAPQVPLSQPPVFAPQVTAPQVSQFQVPQVPQFQIPQVPRVTAPQVPQFQLPQSGVPQVPQVIAPRSVPAFQLTSPQPSTEGMPPIPTLGSSPPSQPFVLPPAQAPTTEALAGDLGDVDITPQ